MSEDVYGIQDTGYVRKPLAVTLAELEAAMVTEFGAGVIQTAQSPFGQLNGLMADLISEVDERNLEIYQSYDPDQSEQSRLDILARLRLIERGFKDDPQLRQAVTNEGQSRVDIQDLKQALLSIEGITYAEVFVNETGEVTNYGLDRSTVAVVVIGGDDSEIAETIRRYVVPGINTYGNVRVTSEIDGQCRSASIIRPIEVEITGELVLRVSNDRQGCPPPSPTAVKNLIESEWSASRVNGLDPSFYTVRTIIESQFSNVEVVSFTGGRDDESFVPNEPVPIGFIEIASIIEANLTVTMI